VKEAKPAELVRFADQAFGRPTEADAEKPADPGIAAMTRDQRAALREAISIDAEYGDDDEGPLDASLNQPHQG
jgi:hypothetical protein